MNQQDPALAMVLCIRNEADFLAAHLIYHRAVGVQRVYLFLDRCTDHSAEIAAQFDWVQVMRRDRDPADRYMSAHQVKCLNEALALARADGMTWLLHIDPDEFACGDSLPMPLRQLLPIPTLARRANLLPMLRRVSPEIAQVILRPKDMLPTVERLGDPFWRQHYFQHTGAIARHILNPVDGEIVDFRKRLGHYKGKAIVRVDAAVSAASAHHWVRTETETEQVENELPTCYRGFHYHFVVTTAQRWLDKHRKFAEYPDHWEKGTPVRFPKQAWKEASLTMSPAEAEAYFARWVALPQRRLYAPMIRGSVVCDPTVEAVLDRAGFSG